jgi:hypothetical protein
MRERVPDAGEGDDRVQSLPGHRRRFPAFPALLTATDRRKR